MTLSGKPSNLYGLSAVVRNAIPLFALLWLAPRTADRSIWAPWLLSPIIGLMLYRLTIVMHDATHATLFVGRRANRIAGSILGASTGVDFVSFSRQHWKHHRTFGAHDDPQAFHYAGLRSMHRRAFVWRLVRPLCGLNLRHTFVESVLAPRNLVRLARTGELAVVACVQVVMLSIVTGFGEHPSLALLPAFSAATFGLFFSQLRGIAEHGAVGEAQEAGNVRTHAPNLLDRLLLYDVAFNYHAEHHEHPEIPSRALRAVHEAAPAARRAASPSMFGTVCLMYAKLRM